MLGLIQCEQNVYRGTGVSGGGGGGGELVVHIDRQVLHHNRVMASQRGTCFQVVVGESEESHQSAVFCQAEGTRGIKVHPSRPTCWKVDGQAAAP